MKFGIELDRCVPPKNLRDRSASLPSPLAPPILLFFSLLLFLLETWRFPQREHPSERADLRFVRIRFVLVARSALLAAAVWGILLCSGISLYIPQHNEGDNCGFLSLSPRFTITAKCWMRTIRVAVGHCRVVVACIRRRWWQHIRILPQQLAKKFSPPPPPPPPSPSGSSFTGKRAPALPSSIVCPLQSAIASDSTGSIFIYLSTAAHRGFLSFPFASTSLRQTLANVVRTCVWNRGMQAYRFVQGVRVFAWRICTVRCVEEGKKA